VSVPAVAARRRPHDRSRWYKNTAPWSSNGEMMSTESTTPSAASAARLARRDGTRILKIALGRTPPQTQIVERLQLERLGRNKNERCDDCSWGSSGGVLSR
jgi:hypothetical protein